MIGIMLSSIGPTMLSSSPFVLLLGFFVTFCLATLFTLRSRQQRTKRMLEDCNLPTVFWRPRFINYLPTEVALDQHEYLADQPRRSIKKMASSSITGILPRMERLGGPYGMYGTVYGVDTAVVHIAHPVPARAVLSSSICSSSSSSAISTPMSNATSATTTIPRRRSIRRSASCGATKAPAYNHFKNFSGDGVFTADGEEWRGKRASIMHCLLKGCTNPKSPGFQRLEQEANRAADSFVLAMNLVRRRNQQQHHQHKGGCEDLGTNIVPLLQRATIGLIYRFITHDQMDLEQQQHDHYNTVFTETNNNRTTGRRGAAEQEAASVSSCSLSSLDDDTPDHSSVPQKGPTPTQCDLPQMANAYRDDDTSPPRNLLNSYLQSVTHIRMIILAQSRSIWFLLPRWVYRTFSQMYRQEERTMGPIRDFATRACRRAKPGSPLAMLNDRTSHLPPGQNSKNNDDNRVKGNVSQPLLDEAITLLFAGQDTTAATLSWTLHLLSLYPDVQARLAKEVRDVLQSSESSSSSSSVESLPDKRFITGKIVSKMNLLDAVIKESMRLYPVAPFVVRKLGYDVPVAMDERSKQHKLTSTTTLLPEGALACVWIYGLHRNKELWDRPNDFVPNRWLDPELSKRDAGQQMNGAYMPFAAGPRNCVGQPLAHVILRVILARIIDENKFIDKRLEREEQDPYDLRKDMQAGFTVLPSGGVRLVVQKRYE